MGQGTFKRVRKAVAMVAALAGLAVAGSGVAEAKSQAESQSVSPPYSPSNRLVFNNPKGSRVQQLAIITEINRAIDATPKGATIRMAQFLFDIDSTTNKLIAANKRGVHVQILVDDGVKKVPQVLRTRKALGSDKTKSSFVAYCRHSCMSDAASVMHAKFYLFSAAGSARRVSMVSSANPARVNTFDSWNNIHTIVGDAKLYGSLSRYFTDMLKDRTNTNYFRTTTSGKHMLYLFPRGQVKAPAVIPDMLNHVACSPVAPGYGRSRRTVVRVAMWGWTSARIDVANRVRALYDKGCQVEVILNSGRTTRPVLRALLKPTRRGVLPVYDAWVDKNHNNHGELYMHHKLVTVNGRWYGRANTKVVYTGSQNFTRPGTVVNNDIILRVRDNAVHDAYMRNLDYIRSHYTKRLSRLPVVPVKTTKAAGRDSDR